MKRAMPIVRITGLSVAFACCTALLLPQHALGQLGAQMKNKIIDDAANQMVSQIQSDSCPEFAEMLKSHKSGGNSSRTSGMMKKDPAARERFVNRIAGPLVNKMIDCDMLPGQ